MSFGHWRLSDTSTQHTLPPHLLRGTTNNLDGAPAFGSTTAQFTQQNVTPFNPTQTKPASGKTYGSGDNDNYNLSFPNMDAFQEWRQKEEDTQMVEFVKGDTHGSKAVPPRFKEHTKLVCARHQRSGRKRYVKKYPDRVRKVPSRKLEAGGCPASISYKTYHDREEVRACYVNQHAHEIGIANLPYTRKGRKEAAITDKDKRSHKQAKFNNDASASSVAGPSSVPAANMFSSLLPMQQQQQIPTASTSQYATANGFQFGGQPAYPTSTSPLSAQVAHERWENMQSLFNHIRHNARAYEYPSASVAALETVLIRLYLESPMNIGQGVNGVVPGGAPTLLPHQHQQPQMQQTQQQEHTQVYGHTQEPGEEEHSGEESNGEMEEEQ